MIRAVRVLYLGYYMLNESWSTIYEFAKYASKATGKPTSLVVLDSIHSVFRYNTSILDFFYFRFYEKTREERSVWAGTGTMYEYQRRMNPHATRNRLENKKIFVKFYGSFIKRKIYLISDISTNNEDFMRFYDQTDRRVVLKNSTGQGGKEVKVIKIGDFTVDSLRTLMSKGGFDILEEYLKQHQSMQELSPAAVNTIRIVTEVRSGIPTIIAARLRISIDSAVDNLAAGNAAAKIDIETGRVTKPAVYSDFRKDQLLRHPVTQVEILGFEIPMWSKIRSYVLQLAAYDTSNKSIGWDIALLSSGPEVIEANHNWCKLLWQLPIGQGLLKELHGI